MYIISVIPISNIPRQDVLTYYYKDPIPLGSIVKAPYNRVNIKAVVIDCASVRSQKREIKSEVFQLKKITQVEQVDRVPLSIIEKLVEYAKTSTFPLSKFFHDLYPTWYWQTEDRLAREKKISAKKVIPVYGPFTERLQKYHAHLEQGVTWICLPTVAEVTQAFSYFKKQHTRVYAFTGRMGEKKQITQWYEIRDDTNTPTTIISTPYYAGIFLPLSDTIVIESYASDTYKTELGYDLRSALCALHQSGSLFLSDVFLPLKDFQKQDLPNTTPTYTLYTKETTRYNKLFIHPVLEKVFIEDMRGGKDITLACLSSEANQHIVCNDCKHPVLCSSCASSMTLVYTGKRKTNPVFRCTLCKMKVSSLQKCAICQSWNLETLGINTDVIKTILTETYADLDLSQVHVSTLSDIGELCEEQKKTDHLIIISLDALIYNTDYDSEEKILRLIYRVSQTARALSIQSSYPSLNVLNHLKTTRWQDWCKQILSDRKRHFLPPFGIVYTITARNKKGLSGIASLIELAEKKSIKHLATTDRLTLYIPTSYEEKIDILLSKKNDSSLAITKDKAAAPSLLID